MQHEPERPAQALVGVGPGAPEAPAGAAIALEREPVPLSQRPRPAKRTGAVATLLAFLAFKAKSLLVLLKALPAAKFMLTSLSMLAMVWFEAQRSGIWFGVGFVIMILIHELGHGYAMKRQGVNASWPIFIPFFGAMIAMKEQPRDRDAEAVIAYGGPLAGTAAALVAAGIGLAFDSRLFMALAYTGFFLNLFNLTPVSPLDGGRVAQAFSRRAWIIGVVVLAGIFLWTHSPQLLLIAALALPRLFSRSNSEAQRESLAPEQQRAWAVRYFGLAAFLGCALYFSGSLLGRT
ncbi:MAG TPA: site-2 protease family protein [Polyangiaceae bacterium]|nr:site-2 protease family protein [Polyangiaceae bacterium]